MDNNCVNIKIQLLTVWSYGLYTLILGMCDLGHMTLHQGHDTSLVMDNNCVKYFKNRSNMAVRSSGPDTDFWHVCIVTLALEIWPWAKSQGHDTPLGQGHETPLGLGQQLCEISRSNMAVRSYDLYTDFGHVCTLTLEIWPWVKVVTLIGL